MARNSQNTDRHHGGPGSSDQDAREPKQSKPAQPRPGEPTNPTRSQVSGGGGERDRHHTHEPTTKR
jgi:hypothetical protein